MDDRGVDMSCILAAEAQETASMPEGLLKKVKETQKAYSYRIGMRIGPSSSLQTGTIGFNLRLNGSVYAVTCRHIANEMASKPPWTVLPAINPKDEEPIGVYRILGGDWRPLGQNVRSALKEVSQLLATPAKDPKQRESYQSLFQWLQDRDAQMRRRSRGASDIFGNIVFAPSSFAENYLWGMETDWMLIKLDDDLQERFRGTHLNTVYPLDDVPSLYKTGVSPRDQLLALGLEAKHRGPLEKTFDDVRHLHLKGIVDPETYNDMRPVQFYSEEWQTYRWAEGIVVGKVGACTGQTFGFAVPLMPHRPEPMSKDEALDYWRLGGVWAVVGSLKTPWHFPMRLPFSKPGDSGSCVWTLDGRVLGIVAAGDAMTDLPFQRPSISYVISIERVMRDMRKHGFNMEGL